MKKLLLIGLLALNSFAGDIKFSWDPSPTTNVTGYTLYAHTNYITELNKTNCLVKVNVGTNLTATLEDFTLNGIWYFGATATKEGLESKLSNIISLEVPQPPTNMRTVVLQYSGTLTNFYDVGFFKLRLP